MKTKEIEVWVRADASELIDQKTDFGFKVYPINPHLADKTFKARLIIEIPERKVEVTESSYDEIIKGLGVPGDWEVTHSLIADIKEKLFGKEI